MRKQWLILGTSLLLTLGMVACDNSNEVNAPNSNSVEQEGSSSESLEKTDDDNEMDDTKEDTFEPVEVIAGGWNVLIENTMREDTLENVSVVLGYTDATTNEFHLEAEEGKEYFLVKLSMTKEDSKETLKWDNMVLLDKQGNTYNRIEDTFIDELGLVRMPGTDLNFGTNEGWIAFEVNEDSEGLTLQYEFENENLEYTFVD